MNIYKHKKCNYIYHPHTIPFCGEIVFFIENEMRFSFVRFAENEYSVINTSLFRYKRFFAC